MTASNLVKYDALVRYDAMCTAIAACHSVDEIKDLHDKALALELYTRQARDLDAERKAADIRLRAERRAGELLGELARATKKQAGETGAAQKSSTSNGGTCYKNRQSPPQTRSTTKPEKSPYAATLERSGISKQTAGRWQELAKIPEPEFEAALADPASKPSTSRLIQKIRDPVPQLDENARVVWGLCWAYERDKFSAIDLHSAVAAMLPSMRADAIRLVPQVIHFYQTLQKELTNVHT